MSIFKAFGFLRTKVTRKLKFVLKRQLEWRNKKAEKYGEKVLLKGVSYFVSFFPKDFFQMAVKHRKFVEKGFELKRKVHVYYL